MKKPILLFACLTLFASAAAQREVRSLDRSGNEKYADKHFQDAELDYRRALAINQNDSVARFNLATTLIRQQDQAKLAEADSLLNGLIMESEQQGQRLTSARSLYQKGEIAMMTQQYDQAVTAFKESLKRNPSDDDARFNYLLAKKLLEKQQQEQQNQDQNKEQNKDQQQKQDQKQQQQQQNKEEQQQQNQQQQQDQQQKQQEQQQQNQQQMSEDQRQSILEQNERDEKETQSRVMRRQLDKDKDKKREMEIRRMNGTLKDW